MPKLSPSDKELMDRQVKKAIKNWQNRLDLNEGRAAEKLKMSRPTFKKWKDHPDTILEKFRYLVGMCKFSDEEILRMVRPEK